MKVLITGSKGQLGQALSSCAPENIELLLPSKNELLLNDENSCRNYIRKCRPDWIINTAAYTQVDDAELNRDIAYSVNALSVKYFLEELEIYNGRLLQISTDYVFSGDCNSPLKPTDNKSPINYYGLTKSIAEDFVLKYDKSKIIRTSWLYGPIRKNFFLTMLNLHKKNADIGIPIKVVSDQVGCPTSIFSLSKVCWEILYLNTPSIMHWSDAGCASWYDFAFLIGEISRDLGLIQNKSFIEPIKSHQLKTKALRPYYSLLDCYETYEILGYKANNWQIELQKVVEYLLVNNPKSF